MAMGYYEIKTAKNGECMFNLKAANHEIILTSETYTSISGLQNGIESVRNNATDKSNFEIKESSNGKFYFVLKAKNHQVIGRSQYYKEKTFALKGVHSVISNAPTKTIKDIRDSKA